MSRGSIILCCRSLCRRHCLFVAINIKIGVLPRRGYPLSLSIRQFVKNVSFIIFYFVILWHSQIFFSESFLLMMDFLIQNIFDHAIYLRMAITKSHNPAHFVQAGFLPVRFSFREFCRLIKVIALAQG